MTLFLVKWWAKDATTYRDYAREAGFQLDKVQQGENPTDWKPMSSAASGVQEIRISETDGIYHIIYIARFKKLSMHYMLFRKKLRRQTNQKLMWLKKLTK